MKYTPYTETTRQTKVTSQNWKFSKIHELRGTSSVQWLQIIQSEAKIPSHFPLVALPVWCLHCLSTTRVCQLQVHVMVKKPAHVFFSYDAFRISQHSHGWCMNFAL